MSRARRATDNHSRNDCSVFLLKPRLAHVALFVRGSRTGLLWAAVNAFLNHWNCIAKRVSMQLNVELFLMGRVVRTKA